jgi:hypothetical protein
MAMINNTMKKCLMLASIAGIITTIEVAEAEESAYRAKVGQLSARRGIGVDTAPVVLRASASRSVKSTTAALLETFGKQSGQAVHATGKSSVSIQNDRALVAGDEWLLEVRAKGNWIRYRNIEYASRIASTMPSNKIKPDIDELYSIARHFIDSNLSGILSLQKQETLEPWYSAHEVVTDADISKGGKMYNTKESVVASKIVLKRAINGIPVLGNGSIVTVFIALDGTVYGFDLNWSPLMLSKKRQEVLDLKRIRARGDIVADSKRMEAKEQMVEEKFECGYFDAGVLSDIDEDNGELQVACVSMLSSQGTIKSVADDVIPAASQVKRDSAWPETALFK